MKARHFVSALILILILLSAVGILSGLTELKKSRTKYVSFFDEKNDFDVLFFGTSHVINGILPLELWNDEGIVSYNMANELSTMPEIYWTFKNSLRYTHPKLVVIDGFMLSWNDKYRTVDFLHSTLDPFPFSQEKAEAVFDLLSLSPWKMEGWKQALPFLWNFALYHERWSELETGDVVSGRNTEKGAERKISIAACHEETEGVTDPDTQSVGTEYLNRIIDECRQKGIEVLLVYLPTYKKQEQYLESHMMEKISEDRDVSCLNLLQCDFINSNTDFSDEWGHLNPAGAKKVTRYLGEYIVQNFDIPDHRGDEAYYDWYDAYDNYVNKENQELRNIKTLSDYLMMLAAENYDIVMEISDLNIWNNDMFREQVQQLGVDMNSVTENTDLLALSDGGWDVTVYDFFNDQQQLGSFPASTVLGDIEKEWTEDDQIILKLNGTPLYSMPNYSTISACPVKIMVMDRTTKELIDVTYFDVKTDYDAGKLNTIKVYR